MFMIEKALIVIIFMYAVSFSLFAAQFVIWDVYFPGTYMTSPATGQQIKPALYNIICTASPSTCPNNTVMQNATAITRNNTVNNPISTAAGVAWDLITLITGTYIFNVLKLLGVPDIFIYGLEIIYSFLLVRAIVGYLRGI